MKVRCLNIDGITWGKSVKPLEVGGIYTVTKENSIGGFTIDGYSGWFDKSRFEVVPEKPTIKKVKYAGDNGGVYYLGVFTVGDVYEVIGMNTNCYLIRGFEKEWLNRDRFEDIVDKPVEVPAPKKVKCVWHNYTGCLEIGKTYNVIIETDTTYVIEYKEGVIAGFDKCKFQVVEDKPKNPIDVLITIGHTITDADGREFRGEHTIIDKYDLASLEKAQKIAICRAKMKQLESELAELVK